MSRRVGPRVLLVHPSLEPTGGASGVAVWALQALASVYRVTVLSWAPVVPQAIDGFFGTTLERLHFETRLVPASWRAAMARVPVPAALWRSSLLMRCARGLAGDFDVVVGTHNECDYGRRAIQYVHYPTYLRPRPKVDFRWYHGSGPLLNAYYRLADAVAGFNEERMRDNITLANSDWTAARIRISLGVEARTVYPPVVAVRDPQPWAERHRGFLAVGRLTPEKEYPRIMRILARVRETHPDITLTIVGVTDPRSRYAASLREQAAALGPWIRILQNVPRATIDALMASHRYGIHGMIEEHFGMAPAEMVRAGMIVWVPNGGGQVEIVGDEPLLRYDNEEAAADVISRVLASPAEEARLREWLAARATQFSEERFVHEIRTVVGAFLD